MFILKMFPKLCNHLRYFSCSSFKKSGFNVYRKILNPAVFTARSVTQSQTNEDLKWTADHRYKWNDMKFSGYDATHAFISFKHMRLIKAAIREHGPIVEENEKLQFYIHSASDNNVSTDSVEFAKRISVDHRAQIGLFEMQLATGCHFVIQYEDIDQYCKHYLLELCDSCDATLIHGELKWPQLFEQKGILSVKCEPSCDVNNIENAEKTASKIGAEVVCKEIDPEGFPYWKFYCAPWDLHETKRCLKKIVDIEEAYVGYVPKSRIALPKSIKNNAYNLIVGLSKIPAIDNVYDNAILTE